MTNSTQPKAIPTPALLIFGKPTSPDLPQASWFRAEDRQAVMAAAQVLKFSVIDIQTEAEKTLTLGVHEGVLKGSGRMIVGSVIAEVCRRIEEQRARRQALKSHRAQPTATASRLPERFLKGLRHVAAAPSWFSIATSLLYLARLAAAQRPGPDVTARVAVPQFKRLILASGGPRRYTGGGVRATIEPYVYANDWIAAPV
jgi:hypothetical protein